MLLAYEHATHVCPENALWCMQVLSGHLAHERIPFGGASSAQTEPHPGPPEADVLWQVRCLAFLLRSKVIGGCALFKDVGARHLIECQRTGLCIMVSWTQWCASGTLSPSRLDKVRFKVSASTPRCTSGLSKQLIFVSHAGHIPAGFCDVSLFLHRGRCLFVGAEIRRRLAGSRSALLSQRPMSHVQHTELLQATVSMPRLDVLLVYNRHVPVPATLSKDSRRGGTKLVLPVDRVG